MREFLYAREAFLKPSGPFSPFHDKIGVTRKSDGKGCPVIETIFDPHYPRAFSAFSAPHWIAIGMLAALGLSMYGFRKAIRNRPRLTRGIRLGLLAALIIPEASLHAWYGISGIWDPAVSLPLELCSLTLFLSVALLLTDSPKLYPLVYFAGIGGAMQAMLTPNLAYPFPHFRFFHFFTVHMAIILTALFMTWIRGYRPTWKSIGYAMLFLNAAAAAVYGANLALGSNYMFLMRKPDTPSLLDMLGPHPHYILAEEMIALALFSAMYALFFALPDHMHRRRNRNRTPDFPSKLEG